MKKKIYSNIMSSKSKSKTGTYYRPKKNFDKSVKEIVRKELADEIEEKNAVADYSVVSIKAAIPAGVVLNGQGNFFKILPEIDQSPTGQAGRAYNTRIGNEINLKSIDIMGAINYAASNAAQNQYEDAKLAVRVMILRAKDQNDLELVFDDMPTDTLIRFGGAAFNQNNGY